MKTRNEIDGSVTITTDDGRKFSVNENDGLLILESLGSELLCCPVSRSKIEIDTPLT